MEILIFVTAQNGNPYIRFCAQWKSLRPVLRSVYNWITNENPPLKDPRVAAAGRENRQSESVTACNGNPYFRFCVQWKSLYAFLRTTGSPKTFVAYTWLPNVNPRP